MKLLVYGINFAPELTGIGKYSGEMVAWLAARGHEVRVITAPPYYPDWAVWQGYNAGQYTREEWQGATVFRTPLWVPRKVTGTKRLIHLASFALSSIPTLLAQWRWKPDLVLVTEPPLFCSAATLAFTKLRGAKSWLHIHDYEVDAAFELGLLKGQRVRSFVASVERALMRGFDRISAVSRPMVRMAADKGTEEARLVLLENWADVAGVRPLTGASPYRAELGIAEDAVVALYSGNMGAKQGLEVLSEMAVMLRDQPGLEFVFCGNGAGRAELMKRCEGMPNVRFLDLQPVERLGDLLGMADIHLLPQRGDAADLVMPSRLTGMLSSGRPVVAGAAPGTQVERVASQCGIVVQPENARAFADAVLALASRPELRRDLGLRARAYAEVNFDRDAVLSRLEKDLQAAVAAR